jgi:hypothetical protein
MTISDAILLLWSRSVKLSQNCEIASGLPCYAYRYDPRNDEVRSIIAEHNIRHCEHSEAISNSQNLTVLPPLEGQEWLALSIVILEKNRAQR